MSFLSVVDVFGRGGGPACTLKLSLKRLPFGPNVREAQDIGEQQRFEFVRLDVREETFRTASAHLDRSLLQGFLNPAGPSERIVTPPHLRKTGKVCSEPVE